MSKQVTKSHFLVAEVLDLFSRHAIGLQGRKKHTNFTKKTSSENGFTEEVNNKGS